MILLELFYFIFLLFSIFYIPGRYLFRIINFKTTSEIRIPLSVGVGLCLFLFFIYLLAWIKLDSFYLLFVLFAFVKEAKVVYKDLTQNQISKIKKSPITAVILFGTLAIIYITGNSGVEINKEPIFYGLNAADGIYYILANTSIIG